MILIKKRTNHFAAVDQGNGPTGNICMVTPSHWWGGYENLINDRTRGEFVFRGAYTDLHASFTYVLNMGTIYVVFRSFESCSGAIRCEYSRIMSSLQEKDLFGRAYYKFGGITDGILGKEKIPEAILVFKKNVK